MESTKRTISIIVIVSLLCFLSGCGVKEFNPPEIKPLHFNSTPPYTTSVARLDPPKPIQPMYGKWADSKTIKIVSESDSWDLIILDTKEYSKIDALLTYTLALKDVIKYQEVIVNERIAINNALKEFLALEREKSLAYRQFWVDAENLYRQEKHEHDKDLVFYKAKDFLITIGGVVVLVLGAAGAL